MIKTITKRLCRSVLDIQKFCTCHFSSAFDCKSTMSSGDKGLITAVKDFIPKLTPYLHKGQCGRIGIIGGSLEYTGAPYFAAITGMKLGADLVYVFCCKSAAPVIKSYSPELIVQPLLDEEKSVDKMKPWLERLHALVIGPGLGRDAAVMEAVGAIINYLKTERKGLLPLIIDADGLHFVTENCEAIKDYPGVVVLTPNAAEFTRLCHKLAITKITDLAAELNAVIVKKGEVDVICNGLALNKLQLPGEDVTVTCDIQGSNRRCGGQGDILSGALAVFVAWFQIHKNISPSDMSILNNLSQLHYEKKLAIYNDRFHGYSLAAYAACYLTKHCSQMAFNYHGRSMTATDMINYIHNVFDDYFEN